MKDTCHLESVTTNECNHNSYTPKKVLTKNPSGFRIDHIFVRSSDSIKTSILEYKLPLPDRVPGKKFSYSDHEAVQVRLRLHPTIHKCTHSRKCEKVVTQHVWNDYIELAEDARYTPYYKSLYKKRKEKIERVFADAKEKHAMRYTPFRGLAQVSNWVRLKFAAMNLKKLARWLARFPLPSRFFFLFSPLTLKTQFSLTRKLGFSTV